MNSKRQHTIHIAMQRSFFSNDFRRGILICISVVIFSLKPLMAQDLRFTQIHASETFLNPAFTGSSTDARFILNFRDQWPNMPQTYVSYRACFEDYIAAIRSGIGVYAFQDNQGDNTYTTTNFGFQYMYQARLGESLALNIGMQFNFAQINLNWTKLQFYDQIDLLYGFNDIFGNPNPSSEPLPPALNNDYFDIGSGALLVGRHFYIGFSAFHLTEPTMSFYGNNASQLPVSFSGQAGLQVLNEKKRNPLVFNPVAVYTFQAGFQQIEAGAYLKKNLLITGLFFKHNTQNLSDIALCAGITKDFFSFAYSYDIAVGDLAGFSGGAHEVSMIFTLPESKSGTARKNQKNILDCPRVL